ncbi:DEAD/DEAH box helicase [Glaciimonas sp. GG7]
MLDPIGGFDRIKNFFISYVETSFRISDPCVTKARRDLLESSDTLATEPLLEPVLRYETSDKKLEELALLEHGPLDSLSAEGKHAFVELALSGLFEGDPANGKMRRKSRYAPYRHQISMLERGIKPGHPGIVTSGTGSGKTESFMLPVLAAIANEAVGWAVAEDGYLQDRWWTQSETPWSAMRKNERRPAAVRALVLYPMNALVEDQMARLRKTLDSDDARAVMSERFAGNRIFFAQYTSATPVTGYQTHPRIADDKEEKGRRLRRLSKLRLAMQRAQSDQQAARQHDTKASEEAAAHGKNAPDKTRYIFPSLDGGEMLSRWDMHAAPPDIMVTNASMLGSMLSREIENPIFDKTRDWLMSHDDAYFYLVFDELHLIRGSAGTEIAFLIKTLIVRLGLDHPQYRQKLRILASSASLPMDGNDGAQSRTYLRDLFAPFGTSKFAGDPGSTDPDFWEECVVKGVPNIPTWSGGSIDPVPFARLMEIALVGGNGFVAKLSRTDELSVAVKAAAHALGIRSGSEEEIVKKLAEAAAAALTSACRDGDGVRATSIVDVASRIFMPGSTNFVLSLRGLMLARALPETRAWNTDLHAVVLNIPSFRFHTFIRNIEGLFAAPYPTKDGVVFSNFTIERGLSHARTLAGEKRGRRLFELLYCEACGDLLIGGQRGERTLESMETELLPSSGNIENLPEGAANEYYDDMKMEEFAVFWPQRREPLGPDRDYDTWELAHLDPHSGVVAVNKMDKDVPDGHIGGYLYFQKLEAVKIKNGKGKVTGARSAQPFCCPKCGTDYSRRPASNRSRSPIRAFRTGVSKASQLIATELFELLHAVSAEAKGICFSDSRQDAANQALEIESMHLRDLRREVLVTAARACAERQSKEWITRAEYAKRIVELLGEGKSNEFDELNDRYRAQGRPSDTPPGGGRIVALSKLLQSDSNEGRMGELVAEFVRMGVHPFDKTGRKGFGRHQWHELFVLEEKNVTYRDDLTGAERADLSSKILLQQYELIDDVIFSNTFFALEETGLAYPCVSDRDTAEDKELDAWLRIFAGAYRIRENQYVDDDLIKEWVTGTDITHKRVKKVAQRIFGESTCTERLTDILGRLTAAGHRSGMFGIGNLYLKMTEAGDPYWRCAVV